MRRVRDAALGLACEGGKWEDGCHAELGAMIVRCVVLMFVEDMVLSKRWRLENKASMVEREEKRANPRRALEWRRISRF